MIEPTCASPIHDTYACRVGKGMLAALDRAQHFARGRRYVLQLDIREFFPSIDHAICLKLRLHTTADTRVRDLCTQIIAGGHDAGRGVHAALLPGDDLFAVLRPRGLPIGNLTSQFWANVFLHPLDLVHQAGAALWRVLAYRERLSVVRR